jgi:hypothetical protein
VLLLAIYQSVFAETHVYNATCEGSYMKEGLLSDDLSVKKGLPIKCNDVSISLFENGNYQVQLLNKQSSATPLGFSGKYEKQQVSDEVSGYPIERVYLYSPNVGAEPVSKGVQGYCFFDDIRVPQLGMSCSSMIIVENKRYVFNIAINVTSPGVRVE